MFLTRTVRRTLALAAVLALPMAAHAQTTFVSFLNGAQEVPPRATPAFGNGTVILNAAKTQISVTLSFQGLTAPLTVAHIHQGAVGVNGPVVIDIASAFTLTNGGTAGTMTNVIFAITAPQVTALEAGLLYFNIHTSTFPGGEIRGQINVVPEPASMVLMATGLAGLGVVVRRRQRAS
jgi:hypothetical protein